MPRNGQAAEIVWCALDPCFVFHTVNSYDREDGRVVMDALVHDRMFWRSAAGPNSQRCALERWTIDPGSGRVERQVIDPSPQEFPRIDDRRQTLPHRYVYTMAMSEHFLGHALYKHDLLHGMRSTHAFPEGRHPCEFVFVPAYDGAAEDEGWLMGLVIDADAETTELVILNAQRLEDEPVAAVSLPHRIPPGFHGSWIPTRSSSATSLGSGANF